VLCSFDKFKTSQTFQQTNVKMVCQKSKDSFESNTNVIKSFAFKKFDGSMKGLLQ